MGGVEAAYNFHESRLSTPKSCPVDGYGSADYLSWFAGVALEVLGQGYLEQLMATPADK